jgi:uncharacterized membrane protein
MQDPLQQTLFEASLRPHRSITRRTMRRIVGAFLVFQCVLATPFLILGFWPISGFMGVDVIALWLAFRWSFRVANINETVRITPVEVTFTRLGLDGKQREWRFNPAWLRLQIDEHDHFGTERVAFAYQGKEVNIGDFLGRQAKADLASSLRRALALARQGPRFDQSPQVFVVPATE